MGMNWVSAPLAAERQLQILEAVRDQGTIRVRLLAEQIGVSEMTIRRDIETLAVQGLIEKIHGGAKLPNGFTHDEPGFDTKRLRRGAEKIAIARAAAELVVPGMVVGISAGSTTYALSEMLQERSGITVVTNSMAVASRLEHSTRSRGMSGTVLLTGGETTPSQALVGPIAVSTLRQLHVDILFLGVHGVHERAGLTTPNLFESEVDQVFIEAASRLVVVADHTKWGNIGMSTIAPLSAVNEFITDRGIPKSAAEALRDHVDKLTIVDVDAASEAASV